MGGRRTGTRSRVGVGPRSRVRVLAGGARVLAGGLALVAGVALGGCGTSSAPRPAPAHSPDLVVAASPSPAVPTGPGDWITYHHDIARSGVAPALAPLGRLGTAWTARLDGAVYGQPLVLGDTVLAATENDTVYALDAGTGATRWSTHVGTPVPLSQLPCGNINPLGITGTMAYDPATGLVFALAETTGGAHTLFGLDARTGQVRLRRAAEPPKGEPAAHQQRGALTVLAGRVYIPYGGLDGDCARYVGAVVGVPTTGDGPLVSYAVPTSREGGIWATGGGVVAGGRLLYPVGNGESTSAYDGSDSILALTPDLALADRFAPPTWSDDNAHDLDLGSMTPAVVGGHVYADGKRGLGYTARVDRMGGVGGQVSQARVCAAYGGPATDRDTVYVPCSDGTRAVRIDAAGRITVAWRAAVHAAGSPVVGGGAVWVPDYDTGVLYALSPATGQVLAQVHVGRMPHFASPTLAGTQAYLGTTDGVVAISGA
jgi:polyvinyl alcohol dehydrogenase (cytochrome)